MSIAFSTFALVVMREARDPCLLTFLRSLLVTSNLRRGIANCYKWTGHYLRKQSFLFWRFSWVRDVGVGAGMDYRGEWRWGSIFTVGIIDICESILLALSHLYLFIPFLSRCSTISWVAESIYGWNYLNRNNTTLTISAVECYRKIYLGICICRSVTVTETETDYKRDSSQHLIIGATNMSFVYTCEEL